MQYKFLKQKELPVVLALGDTILGIPQDQLGDEFLEELDHVVSIFEPFLQKEVHKLFMLFNMRLTNFVMTGRLRPFHKFSLEDRERICKKWMKSRIPLFRTAYVTVKALTGWAYYSLTKSWDEMEFPGHTIGREHITPTLLQGKEPWKPKGQKS